MPFKDIKKMFLVIFRISRIFKIFGRVIKG